MKGFSNYKGLLKQSVARKFIIYIFIFSAVITAILTSIQLYMDYRQGIKIIQNNISVVEASHLDAVINTLWISDMDLLEIQLNGMFKLSDMQHLKITAEGITIAEVGSMQQDHVISKSFQLEYKYGTNIMSLGTLQVSFTLTGLYNRLFTDAVVIAITHAIKTLLVSFFIFIIFYRLVGRHLVAMSEYAISIDFLQLDSSLSLDRPHIEQSSPDELETVVAAINEMRQNLIKDVAEKVQIEKQLRQAMKMEAIGTLAGGIAHDFNNILTAILGYSEIARSQLPAADPIGKDLDQVILAGKRATELVKQILTFSRQGEEDFKPLKVQLILKEVLKLLRSSMPTTIQLKESIAANSGSVLADPTQIHQVLMNLCTNAKHAIADESGTLSISLSEIQIAEEETIDNCPRIKPGTYIDLEISDTGCGMNRSTRSKIFDPFFTTKEKGKGTGLGLSVVHGIIKQHKGEITVVSEQGQGTTFHIYLPVIDEELLNQHVILEDIPQGNGEGILFVDDETVITHMMQKTLENLGYTVTTFTSSIEALNAYQKNPNDFNLVITDMTMPEMTGVELARKLFELQPSLPVILCTGFSETINEAKARSLGICEYIKKPIDNYILAKAIRSALKC